MPSSREEDLKGHIRRFTKRIGEAKKVFDFNEVENLRRQRGAFARQLAEEFRLGYAIIDGKTKFMASEELDEHYESDDVQKSVGVSLATNELLQARDSLIKRMKRLEKATAEEVKVEVLLSIAKEVVRVETIANSINKEVGNKTIDFEAIDQRRKEGEDLMDGFDFTSLE